MIADFQYYNVTYLNGRDALLDSASFAFYENQAEMILEERIIQPYTTDSRIKNCVCELAEAVYQNNKDQNIASEKVGDYSVSYKSLTDKQIRSSYNSIIKKYLAKTGLMYTGVLQH